MQPITPQVPAYLFAAVNLLLLAYFNRFHALSTRIRDLASKDRPKQVAVLHRRLKYVQRMLLYGMGGVAAAMIDICVIAMGYQGHGWGIFMGGVVLVLISLSFAALEIWEGTKALDEELYIHAEKMSRID